jgi:hypothetical protein
MARRTAFVLAACAALLASACDDDPTEPAGEQFRAVLTAANETSPVTSTATGTANFTLNANSIAYSITFAGLTTPANAAHIHPGASGVANPPIYGFTPPAATSGTMTGVIDLTPANVANITGRTVSADSLRKLFNEGTAYVNVHSTQFGGGEIRGQIVRLP